MKECDQFTDHRRAICRGERPDLPLDGYNSINSYRQHWGLPRLGGHCQEPPEPPQPLTVAEVLWNFSKAIVRWNLAGRPVRTTDQVKSLYAICSQCEHLKKNVCQKCGCQCVETEVLLNKLALATEKCPIGKW